MTPLSRLISGYGEGLAVVEEGREVFGLLRGTQFLHRDIYVLIPFLDEHNGDIVSDGVFAAALLALADEPRTFDQFHLRLASGADEYLQKILADHFASLRQIV